MEITKREIIASVMIIALMLILGLMLSGAISDSIIDSNEIYHKAIHINSKDIFEYGMRTNTGNAFIYGDLIAVNPVGYPEIEGEYLWIEKEKEVYTEHSRRVPYPCGKSTCYRTEYYWTWDSHGSEYKMSDKVTFLDHEFYFNQFDRPSDHHIETQRVSPHVRYQYYGIPSKLTGTIFADLKDGDIGYGVRLYKDKTTEQAYEYAVSSGTGELIFFWILWLGATGGAVYGFYYLENRWLY